MFIQWIRQVDDAPPRRRVRWAAASLAWCLTGLVAVEAGAQSTLYVDDDATPGGDGLSWNSPFRYLQDALGLAAEPGSIVTEIRVAGGVYKPSALTDPKDPRSATFQLVDGVALRGGYAGPGTADPDARDFTLYESALSGDLVGNDEPEFVNNDENAYHVLTAHDTTDKTLLEGVSVTAGNANIVDSAAATHRGSAMIYYYASLRIESCAFYSNYSMSSTIHGRYGCAPVITLCTFSGNKGQIQHWDDSTPIVSQCLFIGNTSPCVTTTFNSYAEVLDCDFIENSSSTALVDNTNGGSLTVIGCSFILNEGAGSGVAIHTAPGTTATVVNDTLFESNTGTLTGATVIANATVRNCVFRNNHGPPSAGVGGGMAGALFVGDTSNVTDCLFEGNSAGWVGGAVVCWGEGEHKFVNCVFSRNSSSLGGGMWAYGICNLTNCTFSGSTGSSVTAAHTVSPTVVTIRNSILWGGNGPQLAFDPSYPGGQFIVTYSNVQSGWPGVGNINGDPLFIQPGCDNVRLGEGSPSVNAGNNAYVPPEIDYDIDGNVRIQQGIVDMGAYEGEFKELEPIWCEGDLDDFESSTMVPSLGPPSPLLSPAVTMTNTSGTDNATAMVTQFDNNVHPESWGYSVLGATLRTESSLSDGQLIMRVRIPFDIADLDGLDPLTLDLTWFNAATGDWDLAASANTVNSPGYSGPLGDRIVVVGTGTAYGWTFELGDYGVFYNPDLGKGFVWANVDHKADFAFGVPLPPCLGDANLPHDGTVDSDDLGAVIEAWGQTGSDLPSDVTEDGEVDIDDLFAVLADWGKCG